jgi:hypothetical protein
MMSKFVDECDNIETLRILARSRGKQSRQYLAELEALRATSEPDKVRLLKLVELLAKDLESINYAFNRAWEAGKKKNWQDIKVDELLMWLGHEQNKTIYYMQNTAIPELRNAIAGLPEGTKSPLPQD